MFKKTTLIVLLLCSVKLIQGQVLISLIFGDKLNTPNIEFGLEGGYCASQMTNFESKKWASSFNLGFYFDIRLKNQWFVNTGVLVKSNVGLDGLTENDHSILDTAGMFFAEGNYKQQLNYFHVPITIKYRFKNHFYAKLGPQVALRTKTKVVFTGEEDTKNLKVETQNSELFNRLEVGFVAGFGYKLRQGKGVNIGLKYFEGFTNTFKSGYHNSRNRALYAYVCIPIGRE